MPAPELVQLDGEARAAIPIGWLDEDDPARRDGCGWLVGRSAAPLAAGWWRFDPPVALASDAWRGPLSFLVADWGNLVPRGRSSYVLPRKGAAMVMRTLAVTLALLGAAVVSAGKLAEAPCTGDCTLAVPSGEEVLYFQLDYPTGVGFTDQDFGPVDAVYNTEGADDFIVTDAQGWDVSAIHTAGSQSVPTADPHSVSHSFYADAGGVPGAAIEGCEFPNNFSHFTHVDGDIVADVSGCYLAAGAVWVSQQVRQDFIPDGQHYWATRSVANGNEAVWRNPGNAYGTGCVDWSPAAAACGMTGQDFMFALSGSEHEFIDTPAVGPLGAVALALALGAGCAYLLRR